MGANTGQTLLKILDIDPERPYLGFEPQLTACCFIEQFILDNQLKSHQVLPLALGAEQAILELKGVGLGYKSLYSDVASTQDQFRNDDFYRWKKSIYAVKGDQVLKNFAFDEISLIKIDVEGAEYAVMTGLQESLLKYQPFVIFEVLNLFDPYQKKLYSEAICDLRRNKAREISSFFAEISYCIFQIVGDNELREIETIIPVDEFLQNCTDYLAVPHSLRARVIDECGKVRKVT